MSNGNIFEINFHFAGFSLQAYLLYSRYCQFYPFRDHQLLRECPGFKLKHYILPTYCIYVFPMVLTLNSDPPQPPYCFL